MARTKRLTKKTVAHPMQSLRDRQRARPFATRMGGPLCCPTASPCTASFYGRAPYEL